MRDEPHVSGPSTAKGVGPGKRRPNMNQKQPGPVHSFRIQLVDVSALVVGYGMAAVLFRAFWPKTGVSPVLGLFAVGFYLWLGLAMSGPILLMRRTAGPRRWQPPTTETRRHLLVLLAPGPSWRGS